MSTAANTRKRSIFDYSGRMMSGSKRGPKGHVCVWNANVLTKSRGKFWFGDLDLTADADELKALAAKEGEPVYVLLEMDARFMTEANPRWLNAVAIAYPDGKIEIREDD
jgi:hypothetical protein